ncbi:MAG: hypothetical protein ACOX3K_03870 [Bacilli bacterium]
MFDLMIKILVYSMWIGMIVGPVVIFTLRLVLILKSALPKKAKYLALFLPFSYGVENLTADSKLRRIYHGALIFFFVLLVLGSCFLFYQYKG